MQVNSAPLPLPARPPPHTHTPPQRYFRRGDAYVHAELHGASSTIVKNPDPDRPIPPLTLQQVRTRPDTWLPVTVCRPGHQRDS